MIKIFLLLIFCSSLWAQKIEINPLRVQPDEIQRQELLDDFFKSEELIPISNEKLLVLTLESEFGDAQTQLDKINPLILDPRTITDGQYNYANTFFGNNNGKPLKFIVLSKADEKKLGPKLVNTLRRLQFLSLYRTPKIENIKRENIEATIKSWNLDKKAEKKLIDSIFTLENSFLPINSNNWDLIPEQVKKDIVQEYAIGSEFSTTRKAQTVKITVKNKKEIANFIKEFNLEDNQESITRLLKKNLRQNSNKPLTFNIEEVLPAFIRKNLNKFSLDKMTNCFNTALCANQGKQFQRDGTSPDEILKAIETEYTPIHTNENYRMGDLLLYTNSSGHPIHAATYIGKDLVLTKNGASKFAPYIFQRKIDTDHVYQGQYSNIKVYRHNSVEVPKTKLQQLQCILNRFI